MYQGWINDAFVLAGHGEKKKWESDRLEQWCSISKQLLNEWQSQGLAIRTWENPRGAGGEETAGAAEPVRVRKRSLLLLHGEKKTVWETEKKAVYSLVGEGNIDII